MYDFYSWNVEFVPFFDFLEGLMLQVTTHAICCG